MKYSPDCVINMAPIVKYKFLEEKNVWNKRMPCTGIKYVKKKIYIYIYIYTHIILICSCLKYSITISFSQKIFFWPFIKFCSIYINHMQIINNLRMLFQ